jgi:hypothetical protein
MAKKAPVEPCDEARERELGAADGELRNHM